MLTDFLHRVRSLFRRSAAERELQEELAFHLAEETDKWIRAGLPRAEASRRARIAFGGAEAVKEDCRQERGTGWLDAIGQDTCFAIRLLRRSPGFTLAVSLSLALGIGANTAIFSIIDKTVWQILPIQQPQQLLLVTQGRDATFESGFTYQQFRDMREQNHDAAQLAAWAPARLSLSIAGNMEPPLLGHLVSGNYFSLLGVQPAAGRAIGAEEDLRTNGHPVAMLSHSYWMRRFGGDPDVLGRTLTISGTPFTVIGITKPGFFGVEVGTQPELFLPIRMQPAVMTAYENLLDRPNQYLTWVHILGRLESNVSNSQATAQLAATFRQGLPRGGKYTQLENQTLRLESAATGVSGFRQEFAQPLFLLMLLVAIVLLIACANTANLLLARAAAREPEFAMRVSLGARGSRLVSQLLVEGILLALLGGVLGIAMAHWSTRLFLAYLSAGRTPIELGLSLDSRVLAFTAAVSLATGILFSLWPAIRVSGMAAAGASHRVTFQLRHGKWLSVVQVALSLTLLIGAGSFTKTLQSLIAKASHAEQQRVYVVRVEPKGSDQRNAEGARLRLDRTYRELLDRAGAVPGVDSATLIQFTPTTPRGGTVRFTGSTGEERKAHAPMTYPGYFSTVGIPLLAGRDFAQRDLAENAPLVIVVNETLARQAFPGENATGRRIQLGDELREIIGVVADSRLNNVRADAMATAYMPYLQLATGRGQMALYVRSARRASEMLPRIREVVRQTDRDMPLFEIHTLEEEIDAVLLRERLLASLSGLFSTIALALAAIGLYGLFSFAVARRTRELGIRIALGADSGDVTLAVMREVWTLLAIGIAAGIPLAILAMRIAANHIAGLQTAADAQSLAVIAVATCTLIGVVSLAGYLPARRAARVDPLVALRNE